jgi:hypothetical protein
MLRLAMLLEANLQIPDLMVDHLELVLHTGS